MSVRIVRLGSKRLPGEGARLGTVRRPPRGVARKDYARLDWYDAWFPVLAPSVPTMKLGLASQASKPGSAAIAARQWAAFARKYRAEMRAPGVQLVVTDHVSLSCRNPADRRSRPLKFVYR